MVYLNLFCLFLFAFSFLYSSFLLCCHLFHSSISPHFCTRLQWLRQQRLEPPKFEMTGRHLATRSQRVDAKQTFGTSSYPNNGVYVEASVVSPRMRINFHSWSSNPHAVCRTAATTWNLPSQFSVEQCECVYAAVVSVHKWSSSNWHWFRTSSTEPRLKRFLTCNWSGLFIVHF